MSKCKFKVGDKVKLVGDPQSVREKSALYGQIATIRKIDPNAMYPYALEEPHDFNTWRDTELERVEQPKIVITTDGVKYVTAKLYDGDTVKVAQAMCAPEDTFDFMVGAKLACERLSPKKVEPPKPKYYNGKVVCVSNSWGDCDFTVGKVYEIVNGKFIDNRKVLRPTTNDSVIDLDDLDHGSYFGSWFYKFIPLVED